MEDTQQTEIDETDRRAIGELMGRMRDGDKMADIFGVEDDQLNALEAQTYRLYQNGQFDRAKVAGRGILALDEDRQRTRLILGDIALEEYRFKAAIEHLEAAFELDDQDLAVRTRLGEALLQSGQADGARRHLEAVVEAGEEAGENNLKRCRVLLDATKS